MTENNVEICKTMLIEFLHCEFDALDKVFELLRETRRIFGEEVYISTLKKFVSDVFLDEGRSYPVVHAYYRIGLFAIKELTGLDDIENFNRHFWSIYCDYFPDIRFREDYFKELSIPSKKKLLLTQKLNEFSAVFDNNKNIAIETTKIKDVIVKAGVNESKILLPNDDFGSFTLPTMAIRSKYEKTSSPQTVEIDSWVLKRIGADLELTFQLG